MNCLAFGPSGAIVLLVAISVAACSPRDGGQAALDDEQRATNGEQGATSDGHNATNHRPGATSGGHGAIDDGQDATDGEQGATSDGQDAMGGDPVDDSILPSCDLVTPDVPPEVAFDGGDQLCSVPGSCRLCPQEVTATGVVTVHYITEPFCECTQPPDVSRADAGLQEASVK